LVGQQAEVVNGSTGAVVVDQDNGGRNIHDLTLS